MAAYWTGERKKQPPRRFIFPSHTTTGADAVQNAANPQNRGGGIIVKVQEAVWDEFRREDVEPEMIINRRGRLGLHSNAENISKNPSLFPQQGHVPCYNSTCEWIGKVLEVFNDD